MVWSREMFPLSFRQQNSGQACSEADQKQNGASGRKWCELFYLSRCWSKNGINQLLPALLGTLLWQLAPHLDSQVLLMVPKWPLGSRTKQKNLPFTTARPPQLVPVGSCGCQKLMSPCSPAAPWAGNWTLMPFLWTVCCSTGGFC